MASDDNSSPDEEEMTSIVEMFAKSFQSKKNSPYQIRREILSRKDSRQGKKTERSNDESHK